MPILELFWNKSSNDYLIFFVFDKSESLFINFYILLFLTNYKCSFGPIH